LSLQNRYDALIDLKTEHIVPVAPARLTVMEVSAVDFTQAKLQHYTLAPMKAVSGLS